jgi:hypothetical protein
MVLRIGVTALAMLVVGAAAAPSSRVTFNKDVLPILQRNCQTCHRPGEAAPMPLLTYDQARPWAKAIREEVVSRRMPPWFADPDHGKFSNERTLSQSDINTLVAWVDGGAREGNPKDAPRPLQFAEGWSIGNPDAVVQMAEEFKLPASGTIDYQFILVPSEFTEDKWIERVEIRPTNRAVVHHIVAFVRDPGSKFLAAARPGRPLAAPNSSRQRRPPDDGVGEIIWEPEVLAVYVPGTSAQIYKPGQAKLIKAGSDIVLQMHYTTNGEATSDRTSIGFAFAKQQPVERVASAFVANTKFVIPAGASSHRVEARVTLDENVTLTTLFPHMHVRGKGFEYRAVYPDGRSEILLSVPRYDFNWQLFYHLQKPIVLPKGTRLECTAYFDNSAGNASNPDPAAEVRWGDQSWEEMLAGFFDFSVDPRVDPKSLYGKRKPQTAN